MATLEKSGLSIQRVTVQNVEYQVYNGIYYHRDTLSPVISRLDKIRNENKRVSLYYGNSKTGMIWSLFPDTGTITNSHGIIKYLLLLFKRNNVNRQPILDNHILRITTANKEFKVIYEHHLCHDRPNGWNHWKDAFIVASGGLANTCDPRPDSPTYKALRLTDTPEVYKMFREGMVAEAAAARF